MPSAAALAALLTGFRTARSAAPREDAMGCLEAGRCWRRRLASSATAAQAAAPAPQAPALVKKSLVLPNSCPVVERAALPWSGEGAAPMPPLAAGVAVPVSDGVAEPEAGSGEAVLDGVAEPEAGS